MADNLSGVPPVVTLSGLSGSGTFSGQPQQGLGGNVSPSQGQATPGMTGGLDLMQLLAMLSQGSPGPVTDTGLTDPLGLASFGQPGMGGFGQSPGGFGGFGQGSGGLAGSNAGQSTVAGATGQQPGTAAGTGSLDPLAVLQKTLGLAQKGLGLFDTGTASPTLGDTGGTSLGDVNRSSGTGGTGGFVASPQITQGTAADAASIAAGGGTAPIQGTAADAALQAIPGGGSGGQDPANLQFLIQNTPGSMNVPPELAALGVTPEQYAQIAANVSQAPLGSQIIGTGGLGTGLGEIPGVGITGNGTQGGLGGATGGLSGSGGINALGATAGGLGGLQGLLSLIQSIQSGNPVGEAGGAVNTAAGAAGAADKLGLLGGEGSAALGAVSPYLPLIGALLTGIGAGGPNPDQGGAVTEAALAGVLPALMGSGVGAFAAPVLGIAMAISNALSRPGNQGINRFTGVQGPQTTQALEGVAGLTPQGTDFSKLPTDVLERLIPADTNALERYYNQNLPEDRYLTGLKAEGSPEFGQVQGALNTDRTSLLQAVAQLQQRGVGNDVLGNLLTPQLNNIAQMNNSDWMGVPGYQSPSALMQTQGFGSNQDLAAAYGGPTWLALNQIFGPGLGGALGQYGGTAPGLTLPQAPQDPAAIQVAAQYAPPYQDLSGPQA